MCAYLTGWRIPSEILSLTWVQVDRQARTVRLEPGAKPNSKRRKPRTQDHKFMTGFWPASSRRPWVVTTGFEHVSHLDKRVALRAFARIVELLAR